MTYKIETTGGAHEVFNEPLLPVERLSNVDHIPLEMQGNYPYKGKPWRGFTNGYSTYSNVNVTGEYFLAFGTQPWVAALYRRDGTFVKMLKNPLFPNSTNGLGEAANDIRWNLSGQPGTQSYIFYQFGDGVYRMSAVTGDHMRVWHAPAEIIPQNHRDQDRSAIWRTEYADGQVWLVNLKTGVGHPTGLKRIDSHTEFTISPSGKWLYYDHGGDGIAGQFYLIPVLGNSFPVGPPVTAPTTNGGHDGWALDAIGNEVFIQQDNANDQIYTFNPVTGQRIDVIGLAEMNYPNIHLSVQLNQRYKGWFLLSTYGGEGWAADQLMLVEIGGARRIVRLGSMGNKWPLDPVAYQIPENEDDYFAQAFASFSPDSNEVYWGSNLNGTTNLEVMRMDLRPVWNALIAAPAPAKSRYRIYRTSAPANALLTFESGLADLRMDKVQ